MPIAAGGRKQDHQPFVRTLEFPFYDQGDDALVLFLSRSRRSGRTDRKGCSRGFEDFGVESPPMLFEPDVMGAGHMETGLSKHSPIKRAAGLGAAHFILDQDARAIQHGNPAQQFFGGSGIRLGQIGDGELHAE